MLKVTSAALAAGLMLIAPAIAQAASEKAEVEQTIRTSVQKSNAGDDAGSLAYFAQSGSVIDEFAPFKWDNFGAWFDAAESWGKQNGYTDAKTAILKFRHINVESGHAYAVASVVFSYKDGKRLRKEAGTDVFTLVKDAQGWRINSFAWLSKDGVDAGSEADAIAGVIRDFASGKPSSAPPAAIADEFAPYAWQGPNAAADWFAGLQKSNAADHDTDLVIAPAAPIHLSVNGANAYATVPTLLTFKHNGKPTKEHGAFAFAFDKSSGSWRIASWAWATD